MGRPRRVASRGNTIYAMPFIGRRRGPAGRPDPTDAGDMLA